MIHGHVILLHFTERVPFYKKRTWMARTAVKVAARTNIVVIGDIVMIAYQTHN